MSYINQEEIIVLNMYAPNELPEKYLKQLILNLQKDNNTNTEVFGDFTIMLKSLAS